MIQLRCDDCGEPMGWSDSLTFMCPVCETHFRPDQNLLIAIEDRMVAIDQETGDGHGAHTYAVRAADLDQRKDESHDWDNEPDTEHVVAALGLPTNCTHRDVLAWHIFRDCYPRQIGTRL